MSTQVGAEHVTRLKVRTCFKPKRQLTITNCDVTPSFVNQLFQKASVKKDAIKIPGEEAMLPIVP